MDVKRINDFVRNLDSAINITGITVYGVDDEGHSVKIDTEMLANPKPTFTEASTRTNIVGNGELTTTLWGKVKKWFSDLKSVAFSGSYNDLSNTPELKTVATTGVFSDLNDKNVSTGTVAFTEASSRTNIATGESQSTIFGKIKKFFTDLKAVAFSGSYNDLSNKPLSVESNKVKYTLPNETKLTLAQESSLANIAFSGSYKDLIIKPSAFAYANGNSSAKYYKVASFENNNDVLTHLTLFVSSFFTPNVFGFVNITVRWRSQDANPLDFFIKWLTSVNVDNSQYIITRKRNNGVSMISLYIRAINWESIHITRIAEHGWTSEETRWNFSDTSGVDTIPSDEIQQASTNW